MPEHHLSEELLMDYAAGSAREPVALLIATHLALCPACRMEVGRLEAVGGTLLEQITPEQVTDASREQMLARLDEPDSNPVPAVHGELDSESLIVPRPLRDYLDGDLASLNWKSHGPNLTWVRLLREFKGYNTFLHRMKAGKPMPCHTHEGMEMSVVLAGGYTDELGHFLRGDFAAAGSDVTHRPIADAGEDCISLTVIDASIRLTGPVGRFVNPFLRR